MMANATNFPAEELEDIRRRLLALPEDKLNGVVTLNFKNPTMTLVFAILLGCYGVDRFYLGEVGLGIAKVLTCGGCYIWAIVDWFSALRRAREYNLDRLNEYLG